jgi:hypothetical protein
MHDLDGKAFDNNSSFDGRKPRKFAVFNTYVAFTVDVIPADVLHTGSVLRRKRDPSAFTTLAVVEHSIHADFLQPLQTKYVYQ